MKKAAMVLMFGLLAAGYARAQTFAVYAGKTSVETNFWGVSLGGNILSFLQLQVDVFKYINHDEALYSPVEAEDRSDFLGLSGNVVLKLPIHLLPYLHSLDFIQPFILRGYGAGLENLSSEYWDAPDLEGDTGVLTKVRTFDVWGGGVVIMITRKLGIKADYRSLDIPELENMGYPARRINRFSFGICF